jgi:uncharacterized membrane protein YkvA (DUF1232 family)
VDQQVQQPSQSAQQASRPRSVRNWLGMLQVHNIARLFLALQADSRVSPLLKLQAWCGLIYIFSPLDIMPELFTGIGLLDDIIVALIIMQAMLEYAPRYVVEEHCARLGVHPDQIFISVPQTVREARSLYAFVRELSAGIQAVSAEATESASTGANVKGSSAGPGSEAASQAHHAGAPGSRYSAYRKPDEEA